MLNIEWVANILNAFACLLNIWAHAQIGLGNDDTRGYWLYVFSGSILIIGSCMLGSWPIVALNAMWVVISIYGLLARPVFRKTPPALIQSVYLAAAVGVFSLGLGFNDIAAIMTTYIYFIAYALLNSQLYSKKQYLIWCSVGFVLLVAHLIEVNQYSVLASESLAFCVGVIALIKIQFSSSNA